MIFNGRMINRKQQEIIVSLFLFRGFLFDQIASVLADRLKRPLTNTFRQNTYKDLQKLTKLKLIARDPIQIQRMKHFIYLTEDGLEIAYQLLDITPGHTGEGFNQDYGEFPYELQRPPKGPAIHHHILLTDVLLVIDRLKAKYPDLGIDYRDNRYCSVQFESEG